MSPVLAYLWCGLTTQSYLYGWAELCLKFAGCRINYLAKSHNTAFYEQNGCLFFSTRADDGYNKAIDTYITEGWALNVSPYSYLSRWWKEEQNKTDLATILATSGYNKIIVYPDLAKEEYISFAWDKQMSIQIILTQDKALVLDIKQKTANYGTQLSCYRSEIIRPKYFNTCTEFAEYIELSWADAHLQLENKVLKYKN